MSFENDIEFSIKILCLINGASESTVFSPASILNGLSIILAAAKGETANQIVEAFGNGRTADEIMRHCSETTIDCKKSINEFVKIEIANRMFVSNKKELISNFTYFLQTAFESEAKSIDFENIEECVKEINEFAENSTNGQIKEVISSDDIDEETSAVLINAVYFKGQWNEFFDRRFKAIFLSNPPREIDYIHRTIFNTWYYNKGEDWESVGIPYKYKDVWMFIIVPKEKDGLNKLIEKMDARLFFEATQPNTEYLDLDIPAFEITKDINLKETFQKMGITNIFSDQSDLSNMIKEPTKIGKILHKATISVDEFGTEASGVTTSTMVPMTIPYRLRIDCPFLYFITVNEKHTETRQAHNLDTHTIARKESLFMPKKGLLFAGTFC